MSLLWSRSPGAQALGKQEWTEVAPGFSVDTSPCEGCGVRPVKRRPGEPFILTHEKQCPVAAADAAEDARRAEGDYDDYEPYD
jgi:hypothetical protein